MASLLLLWLGSLPEPLFPAALVPELAESQQSDYYEERLASVRGLLKRVRSAGPGWAGLGAGGGRVVLPLHAVGGGLLSVESARLLAAALLPLRCPTLM